MNTTVRKQSEHVAVVGLGYVGLPLALYFAEHYIAVGYDLSTERVAELSKQYPMSTTAQSAAAAKKPLFTHDTDAIAAADSYVIVVPTPLTDDKPDLSMLESACEHVGGFLQKGDLVVIESTVYPGVTEEVCIPTLERCSGLNANKNEFYCGYSPERVRPASAWSDPSKIVKIVSGLTEEALARVASLYEPIIEAGIYPVSSIKIAEMTKIVENVQRDVDVALSNEMAMACATLGINTHEVLDAASTKWNFRRFQPGLVGGHCISVDPIYLSHRLRSLGQVPQLTEEARRVNDSMPEYICQQAQQLLKQAGIETKQANVLLMGFSFKENINDYRNTLVMPIIDILRKLGCAVRVCDPLCDPAAVKREYNIEIESDIKKALGGNFDVVIFTVAHDAFGDITVEQLKDAIVMDVKGCAPKADWQL